MPNKPSDYVSEGGMKMRATLKDVFVPESLSVTQTFSMKHPNAEKTMPESRLSSDHVFEVAPKPPFTANATRHSEDNGPVRLNAGTKLANKK